MNKTMLADFTLSLYEFFNQMLNAPQDCELTLTDFFTDDFCMISNAVQVANSLHGFSENLEKLKNAYTKVKFDLPFKDILVVDDKVAILLDIHFSEKQSGQAFVSHVMAIYYLDSSKTKFNKKIEITSFEKISP